MNKFFTLLVPILMGLQTYAQVRYAYLPEGKTSFQTSTDKLIVGFKEGHNPGSHVMNLLNLFASDAGPDYKVGVSKWNIFTLRDQEKFPDSLSRILSSIRGDSDVAYANPFLLYKDGTLQGLTDQVIVRVKASGNLQALASLYTHLSVYVVKENPYTAREYFLTIHPAPGMDALDVADSLYGTGLFEYAEPDFVKFGILKTVKAPNPPPTPNDPLFGDQWNLLNTGQYDGTAGSDIKAPEAWCTTTGTGIKIAIIDEGVDLVHPDLKANLLPGYDALGQGTNGAPTGNDAHGTACAGIAAAIANNDLGVAGVANTCKIIPVRAGSLGSISTSAATTGIGWAASAAGGSADVFSCSWGGGSSSSSLNTAIANAISSGRGGKGCVFLFSSGDANTTPILYPSNLPNVVSVGGTNMCDQRIVVTTTTAPNTCNYDTRLETAALSWGSTYGTGLGIVAPGINIATTDMSGAPGFCAVAGQGWICSGTDYLLNFDGTSASCPQAAAVVALILSVNPSLYYSGAINILETTADKVGGYSYSSYLTNGYWNDEMGYGRIDAGAAVGAALASGGISGPSYICSGSATYSVTPPSTVTTTWSLSGTPATLSCTTCNSTTLTPGSAGSVILTATFSNACGAIPGSTITKSINLKENPLTETNTQGACSGTTQTWTLSVAPSSEGSNYDWYVSYLGTNASIYINSPGASQTLVDVTGGGTVSLKYTDICGVAQTNGATVYSECGGEEFVMAPNPASSSVIVSPAENTAIGAKEASSMALNLSPSSTLSLNADSLNKSRTTNGYGTSYIQMIKIYDVNGTLKKMVNFSTPVKQATLNVADLIPGLYFVQIFDGRLFSTKKLIIQK
jgi:subtilisin family serine protease